MLASGTVRNAQRTRERLLQAAFREIHRSGFRAMDLKSLLQQAGVTKGALYHHFVSKEALGYAVVEDVIAPITREQWLRPLQACLNPVDALIGIVLATSLRPEDVRCGCPLNNLSQEMATLDEGFRHRTAQVFADWHAGIAAALERGQGRGLVRPELDPGAAATHLIALYEGYLSLAKNARQVRVLQSGQRSMIDYLQSLRVPPAAPGA
jgi:AcrR family transcriptional regulator